MTTQTDRGQCAVGIQPDDPPIMQRLIPIAVVIAGGCEPCAERMVRRALEGGTSRAQVLKAIAIVEQVHGSECFRSAVGPQVCERMVRPLARARRTAEEAPAEPACQTGGSCC